MREDQLAEGFGVSRVPVREAIQRLAAEGYVTLTPNAGARVATPSAQDARDLLQVRTALEVLAVRLATERRGGDRIEELAELLEAGERNILEKNFDNVAELAERFHEAVIAASGNAQLQRVLTEVRAKLAWIWAVDIEQLAPSSWEAHREILAAIRSGDTATAVAVTASHVARDEGFRAGRATTE